MALGGLTLGLALSGTVCDVSSKLAGFSFDSTPETRGEIIGGTVLSLVAPALVSHALGCAAGLSPALAMVTAGALTAATSVVVTGLKQRDRDVVRMEIW